MESEGESEEIPFSFAKRFSLDSNFALGRPHGRRAEDDKIAKMPIIVMLNPAEITGFRLCSDFGISVHYGTIKIHVRHSF